MTVPGSPTVRRRRLAAELREIVEEAGADTVVCDGELSPSQLVHLEDVVRDWNRMDQDLWSRLTVSSLMTCA